MTFIDGLKEGPWRLDEIPPGRINLLKEGVITLFGIKRLESEALFVSSEGIGTLRETSKVVFAGKERYWLLARKVNGVIRRVLLDALNPSNCSVDNPCIECPVCLMLGGLSAERGKNQAVFARVKLQDLISVEPYEYDEKFRVRLNEKVLTAGEGTVPFQEVIVPPGTRFPFIVRIFKPTRFDLAAFLYANKIADALGYGSYTKLRGDVSTEWKFIADGMAFISVFDFLSQLDLGTEPDVWVKDFVSSPKGIVREIISGKDCKTIEEGLISWFVEKHGVKLGVPQGR